MLKPLITLLILISTMPSAYAELSLKPFVGYYHTSYDLGLTTLDVEGKRSLQQQSDGSWVLDFRAKNWFARLSQTSTFLIDDEQQLKPQHYRRYQKVFGKVKDRSIYFHWDQLKVTNDIDGKPWKMDIPADALDLISYQLKLRYDLITHPQQKEFHYRVADGGKVKDLIFRVIGPEVLKTPMGKLNTTKLESIRHKQRDVQHLIWVATDWDNLLLRVEPVRRKDKEKPIFLDRATLDGKEVKGF
ncbi:DUF3108 domain-containing protein [Oceanospirillum beijerinckii]|uniref:DUF3108 domain-containing protein n=1 Tax=Oceanospirillum beijerinckii TaxID=64976 RepID=UPI000428C9A3|nr:DUF3108 domain-containing protein [Oceanospirillum beijerinckii]MAC47559.1 DUF3108 domain-containing protein [Oceanospirillum sp.]